MISEFGSDTRAYLVNYSVPSKAGVVDYNVDLAPSEFRGFLHKLVNILCV